MEFEKCFSDLIKLTSEVLFWTTFLTHNFKAAFINIEEMVMVSFLASIYLFKVKSGNMSKVNIKDTGTKLTLTTGSSEATTGGVL